MTLSHSKPKPFQPSLQFLTSFYKNNTKKVVFLYE